MKLTKLVEPAIVAAFLEVLVNTAHAFRCFNVAVGKSLVEVCSSEGAFGGGVKVKTTVLELMISDFVKVAHGEFEITGALPSDLPAISHLIVDAFEHFGPSVLLESLHIMERKLGE
ncbi:MAG: hypothetical protein KDD68_01050, partial [Bdellovibrionales bacterium]|nr:hypothetical protein [Bdellovibrionales bacterium]